MIKYLICMKKKMVVIKRMYMTIVPSFEEFKTVFSRECTHGVCSIKWQFVVESLIIFNLTLKLEGNENVSTARKWHGVLYLESSERAE